MKLYETFNYIIPFALREIIFKRIVIGDGIIINQMEEFHKTCLVNPLDALFYLLPFERRQE